jgi:hypothetical protein
MTMAHADDDPLDETFARMRDRADRFDAWLEHLRSGEPMFAAASALFPADMNEWQSVVYLLTGCDQVWRAVGTKVLTDRSLGPVVYELEQPRRGWASSEDAVMEWAAHFWDVDRWPARFPYVFEEFYFRRWITACHLYKRIPPALTITEPRGVV